MKEKFITVWKNLKFPILFNLCFAVLWRLIITLVDQESTEYAVPALIAYFMIYGGFCIVHVIFGVWFGAKKEITTKQMWLVTLLVFVIAMITLQPLFPALIDPQESIWLVFVSFQEAAGFLVGFLIGKLFRFFSGTKNDGSDSPLQKRKR